MTALKRYTDSLRKGNKTGNLDPEVNATVICQHHRLGLKPLSRVNVITGAAWSAVSKKWPDAIHLPCGGPAPRRDGVEGGDVVVLGTMRSRANGHKASANTSCFDPAEAWLCSECQNEKIEGVNEVSSQVALRNEELKDTHLFTLYNSMRTRNKVKGRGVIKCLKKEDLSLSIESDEGQEQEKGFALIDGAWLDSWLDYISDPLGERPGSLDNQGLKCCHGLPLLPDQLHKIYEDVCPMTFKRSIGYDGSQDDGFVDSEIITMVSNNS